MATSSRSDTLPVSSMVAIDALRLRLSPSLGVLSTKIPPPGPRVARTRFELESIRRASRNVGRLTPNSVASSCSVPRRSPGLQPFARDVLPDAVGYLLARIAADRPEAAFGHGENSASGSIVTTISNGSCRSPRLGSTSSNVSMSAA